MLKVILIISVVFIVGIKANCSNRYHDQSCSHGRLYRNGNSCTSYFQCSYNRMFHCKCGMYRGSSYLIFDEARQRCEWAGQRWGRRRKRQSIYSIDGCNDNEPLTYTRWK